MEIVRAYLIRLRGYKCQRPGIRTLRPQQFKWRIAFTPENCSLLADTEPARDPVPQARPIGPEGEARRAQGRQIEKTDQLVKPSASAQSDWRIKVVINQLYRT
jgi:hypothetical protein